MKSVKTSTDRYFEFLQSVSKRERGFTNIGKLLEKAKIGAGLGKIVREKKLMEKDDKGVWHWIGGEPTMGMAQSLLESVSESINRTRFGNKSENKAPALPQKKHNYTKRTQQKSSDIIDLSALRQERIQILNRVEKIDAVLEVVSTM